MIQVITPIVEPCFLVGAECSGATVIRLMLDGHPEVAFVSEMDFVVSQLPPEEWPDMESYLDWLPSSRVFHDTGFRVDRRLCYLDLMNSFLRQKLDWGGPAKHIVGGTVHKHFDRILRIWPDARFIHLVRDPRDVAASVMNMGWAGNVWAGVEPWIAAETLWEGLRKNLPAHRYLELTFEEVCRDTVTAMTRACHFLGVRFSPAMLDYPKRTTYDLPVPELAELWKRQMSPEEVRLVEARLGALLEARHYPPSGLAPLEVTPTLERRLRRQDRWGRVRFGIRRYGLQNMMAGFIAKHLRLKSTQRRVRIWRHSVDQVHLK
ncbi:MAG: sulfotransferase [FCB group bacterium]|jgi:hypothetical protein|nr:sulfotransferase [FCB group bacterium]